jgi:hypothetical protein
MIFIDQIIIFLYRIILHIIVMSIFYVTAKEVYTPEPEPPPVLTISDPKTSRVNSFEIENLLKVSI